MRQWLNLKGHGLRDRVLAVSTREAEPGALLQTEDTRKQTVVAKRRLFKTEHYYKYNKSLKRSDITNIVHCKRKRYYNQKYRTRKRH
jgi:hypothetical protein